MLGKAFPGPRKERALGLSHTWKLRKPAETALITQHSWSIKSCHVDIFPVIGSLNNKRTSGGRYRQPE
ncbi:hypothetical protein COCNU_01G012900 [Cocos nucifera]|uniref:Uncharacterized protein n=1 Tax=Cocos nucifera TaxID=13894 RepID=A0A8K0MUT9_COCNU|nr:hypothetical protein COCNU_01G012900 [Cocos nucifera]